MNDNVSEINLFITYLQSLVSDVDAGLYKHKGSQHNMTLC